jgi:RNA polymerase sigma factor (sigma-70 family)
MNSHFSTTSEQVGYWIEQFKAGNPKARNALLEVAQQRLDSLASRMLGNFPNVAERTSDIRQDVMIRLDHAIQNEAVCRRLVTARDYFNLAACHIRWVLLNRHRKQPPVDPYPPDGGGSEPGPPEDNPEVLAIWGEIHAWIEALPEDERELWNLLWYLNLSQNDAADCLGIPRETLRYRWQATRMRLAERFSKELDVLGSSF